MVDQTSKDSLHPIAVMIDELKCDDQKKRIASVKNLSTIAIALGPERTRSELLPYVLELLDDDDEVLVALAETLSTMLEYAGGPQYAEHVLKPLEKLCTIEETAVREKVSFGLKMTKCVGD
jgi:serine/threonine-protein phosphatase 2A regulatory subunit A